MKHIVIDFEFTAIPKKCKAQRKLCHYEIVEIGAVKLNENYEVVDKFSAFVKPTYSFMSKVAGKLTGITNNDIEKAPSFEEAVQRFLNWIGDDFEIYTWSENDRIQFESECALKSSKEQFQILLNKQWQDVQLTYLELVGLSSAISLQRALNSLNISFEGNSHRATDDALNTASILQVINSKEEFQKRFVPLQNMLAPKIDKPTLGDLLGDKLQLINDLTA